MSLVVTPRELTRRAELYQQLSQLVTVGITLVRALEQLSRNPPSPSYRQHIQQLLAQLAAGNPLGESLRRMPPWLPDFDITLLEAGEKSGRLDASFRMLGDYYAIRAKTAKSLITKLAYPAFLLHLSVAVATLVLFFWYANLVLLPITGLFVIYILVFLAIYSVQSKHSEAWRSKVESALSAVPVLGSARECLALSRLCASLEALISAGVTIIEAWEMAATASGSIKIKKTVFGWRHLLEAGQTPAEVLQMSGIFPSIFANQYASGEISGKLEDTLRRLRDYYQDEGERKSQILAQWVPIGIYILVLVVGGAFVIWFWVTYFQKVMQASNF